jgi:hypothetical protein
MPKYTSSDWDEVRKKFRTSIMAETSLVSLAQNLDMPDWPHTGEEEKPTKYIDFTWDELLLMPEIAGKPERIEQLVAILKETLAFDDPFGDMVAQVEESHSKENPILKTLDRLGIPWDYPIQLANFSDATRAVCLSEGVNTISEFANLGQKMATRVVLGGDFRNALNALTHGDIEGIGQFLPYRKGSTGLHLAEAIGLVVSTMSRADQLALAKYYGAKLLASEAASVTTILTRDQAGRLVLPLHPKAVAVMEWFKADKAALLKNLSEGLTLERYFVVLNDPAREAIAVRLAASVIQPEQISRKTNPPAAVEAPKKKGFFSRLFG